MAVLDDALRSIHDGRGVADDFETDRLDFKRQSESLSDTQASVADAAICFANAGGGIVVLGVRDRVTGPGAFSGTTLDAQDLRRKIHDVTQPALDVHVQEKHFEGTRLLIVSVQEGLDVYLRHGKTPTRRLQKDCLPMTSAEISHLHDERRGIDWSAVETEFTLADAGADSMSVLRSYLWSAQPETGLTDKTDDDLLRALSLITADGRLTRAGALLLVDSHQERITYQYRRTPGGEVAFGRRYVGPLLTAFSDVMQALEARIGTTPVSVSAGQQLQIEDYPLAALREAVVNGLMHGDHRVAQPLYIEHSPQMLTVRSPGPLVSGVSPQNILTHPPRPRFKLLADAFRSLGLAERYGQGVDRMFREMMRTGRTVPAVEVTTGAAPETSIRFIGSPPNARVTRFVSELPPEQQTDTDVLLVLTALMARKTVNADVLSPVVQRDAEATQVILHGLATADEPLIEPVRRTARRSRPDYQLTSRPIAALGSALAYQARPRADRDAKIIEHVREYDSVNNAAVQRMFDVDVYAARDHIQDLVSRGILVRTSEQSRGTAVRYGRGPAFPARRR